MTTRHDPLSLLVSRCLAAGTGLAMLSMGAGVVLWLARGGGLEPAATPFSSLLPAAAGGDPTALLSLGIAVMLATPAARVAVLLAGYLGRRDWLLAALAAAVLLILASSLFFS